MSLSFFLFVIIDGNSLKTFHHIFRQIIVHLLDDLCHIFNSFWVISKTDRCDIFNHFFFREYLTIAVHLNFFDGLVEFGEVFVNFLELIDVLERWGLEVEDKFLVLPEAEVHLVVVFGFEPESGGSYVSERSRKVCSVLKTYSMLSIPFLCFIEIESK